MRLVLLSILFISFLFSSTFVETFHNEQKQIIDNLYSGGDQNTLIEKKKELYSKFTKELKEKSYGISNRIKNDSLNEEEFFLANKIKVNSSRGNDLAVFRDEIKLMYISILKSQNLFYIELANILQLGKDKDGKVLKRLEELNKIDISEYEKRVKELEKKDKPGKIELEVIEAFKSLEYELNREKDFMVYLKLNKSLFNKKDLMSTLELNVILEKINSTEKFHKLNVLLNQFNLNVGKLSLISSILVLLYIIAIFVNKIIKTKIDRYLSDLKIKNFDFDKNIKLISVPSRIFVIFFAIDFSFEILFYPSELNSGIQNTFYFIHLASLTWLIIGFIDFFLLVYFEKKFTNSSKEMNRVELINFLIKFMKFIILIIALLIYLNYLEVDISTIIASLGVTSLAVALAAKDTLSNFFGSINILLDNSLSQGDWIEFDGKEGTVIEIGMRSTTIRTFDNSFITVPNATLASSAIKNWNKRKIGRRIKTHIGVTYNSNREDLEKAVEEIREMLMNHPGIATDKTQFESAAKRSSTLIKKEDLYGVKKTLLVYFDQFNDYSLDILIYCFTRTVNWEDWLKIKQDVYFKIWQILEKNNLEMAFPTQTIEYKNISKDELPIEK